MTQSHHASRLNALFALWEGHAPAPIVKDLLSFAPTCHVISTASGMRFFTCCAVDTFLIAHLLDEDVDIKTTPPGHTEPLRINVGSEADSVGQGTRHAALPKYSRRNLALSNCHEVRRRASAKPIGSIRGAFQPRKTADAILEACSHHAAPNI